MEEAITTDPLPRETGWKHWCALFSIIAAGTAVRIMAAVSNGRYWFDEMVTVKIAEKPLGEMWRYLAVENHPPLHYYLIHGWMKLVGDAEIAVKMSSVLGGALGILATYGIVRRLFGARAGIAAVGLYALSAFQIFYSAEARMYSWLYFFCILSLWGFWEAYYARGGRKALAWWAVATLLALYTHLGAGFLLAVQVIFYFLSPRLAAIPADAQVNYSRRRFVAMVVAIVAAWSPWLYVFVREKMQTFNRNAWYFWVEASKPFPIEATHRFFLFDNFSEFLDFFGWVLIAIALVGALCRIRWVPSERSFRVAGHWNLATAYTVTAYLVPLVAGFFAHVWIMKMYMVAAAGEYLLLGKGLARLRLPGPLPQWLLPLVIAALLFASTTGVLTDVRPAWKEVGEYIAAREGTADGVIVLSHSYELAVRYYYDGATPVQGFYPLPDDYGGDVLMRAVRRNWYTILNGDNVDMMEGYVQGKDRILVVSVENFYEVERVAIDWLFTRGWRLVETKGWGDHFTNPRVLVLQRATAL